MPIKRDPTLTIRANDKTKAAFKTVGSRLGTFKKSVFSASTAIAGLVGVAGLGAMIKSSIDAADQIGKLSTRLGASTEALSEYRHVAELSGVAFNSLAIGLQRMTRRVSEAAVGSGEAKAAIKELGLSAVELAKLRPDQQFEIIADALAGLESQTDRVRLGFKLFDSEGVALLQTMKGGAAGIREMRQEARDLGLSMDSDLVAGAEEAKDAMARLSGAGQGLSLTLTRELAPALADLMNDFAQQLPESIKLAKAAMDSFWLVVDPDKASDLAQLKELSIAIGKTTREIIHLNEVRGDGFGGGKISELIAADEKKLLELKAQYDEIAARIEAERTRGLQVDITPGGTGTEAVAAKQEEDRRSAIIYFALRAEDARIAQEAERAALFLHESDKSRIERSGYRERLKFSTMTTKKQVKTILGTTLELTRGVAHENKTMFKINKAAGIANAIINTHAGVTKSLSAYPWPLAGVMAALHLAAGMAQVSAIKGASFGGGGGGGGGLGGGGSIPATAPSDLGTPVNNQGNRQDIRITVEGSGVLSRDQTDEIARSLGEYFRDGGEVSFG